MARTILHVSLSTRGYILGPDCDLVGLFRSKVDGHVLTPREARDYLLDMLALGWEHIPCDPSCTDFDPKMGCRGHMVPDHQPNAPDRTAHEH